MIIMENWQEWTVDIRMRPALNKEHNYCDKKPEGRVGWGKKIPKTGTIKTFCLTNEHQSTSAFEQLMRGPKSKGRQSLDFDFIG